MEIGATWNLNLYYIIEGCWNGYWSGFAPAATRRARKKSFRSNQARSPRRKTAAQARLLPALTQELAESRKRTEEALCRGNGHYRAAGAWKEQAGAEKRKRQASERELATARTALDKLARMYSAQRTHCETLTESRDAERRDLHSPTQELAAACQDMKSETTAKKKAPEIAATLALREAWTLANCPATWKPWLHASHATYRRSA